MLKYILRRIILLVPILFGLSIFMIVFIHLLPGDPCASILGEHTTPDKLAACQHGLGLDEPLWQQYLDYMSGVLHGDFGTSATTRVPVLDSFITRFPATVELSLAAMTIAVGVGIPLGVAAAKRAGTTFDNVATVTSLIGISIPIFFLGLLLLVHLRRLAPLAPDGRPLRPPPVQLRRGRDELPALGVARHRPRHPQVPRRRPPPHPARGRPGDDPAGGHRPDHPVDDARGAQRGLRPDGPGQGPDGPARSTTATSSATRCCPISTVIGLQMGLLLGGAVLTETIFAWGGVGTWLFEAAQDKDFVVIQSGTLILATLFVLVNLAVDVGYAYLNPRIRYT